LNDGLHASYCRFSTFQEYLTYFGMLLHLRNVIMPRYVQCPPVSDRTYHLSSKFPEVHLLGLMRSTFSFCKVQILSQHWRHREEGGEKNGALQLTGANSIYISVFIYFIVMHSLGMLSLFIRHTTFFCRPCIYSAGKFILYDVQSNFSLDYFWICSTQREVKPVFQKVCNWK